MRNGALTYESNAKNLQEQETSSENLRAALTVVTYAWSWILYPHIARKRFSLHWSLQRAQEVQQDLLGYEYTSMSEQNHDILQYDSCFIFFKTNNVLLLRVNVGCQAHGVCWFA